MSLRRNDTAPTDAIKVNPLLLLLDAWATVEIIVRNTTVRRRRNWLVGTGSGQSGFDTLTNLLYDKYLPLSNLAEGRLDEIDRLSIGNAKLANCVEDILSILYDRWGRGEM